MPDEAIALTLSKADAEVLLACCPRSATTPRSKRFAAQRASRSTGSWPSWADQEPGQSPPAEAILAAPKS